MDLAATAAHNFQQHLRDNRYPGRGLVVGRGPGGDWLQVYWIMGRSEHSRNRRFVQEGVSLRTEAVDVSKVADPALIIYEAMLEDFGVYVVSNGLQTRDILDTLEQGGGFDEALERWEREPDPPNFTPRISALLDLRGRAHAVEPRLTFSILRANDADPAQTDRITVRPALPPPGFGLAITTYTEDGDPLPPYRGDPLWLPLDATPQALMDRYWDALDAGNTISLALKRIPPEGGPGEILLRNRYGDA